MRVFTLLIISCLAIAGCSAGGSHALGKPVAAAAGGTLTPVASLAKAAGPVTVQGTMIEKCPVAGCWFMLRDKSGVVRVDTKGAGFVVTDVPLNTTVTVDGTVKTSGERIVVASGLRY